MTGIAFEIHLDGLAAMQQRLDLLARMDIAPLRENVGALVESQTRRRIHSEKTSPSGKAWAPWGPNWASSRHKGHGLLENEGDLLDDIHFAVSAGDIEVGSNLVYAAIQHFGGDEVGIPIPSREYLGLSDENWAEIIDLTDDFISRVLN